MRAFVQPRGVTARAEKSAALHDPRLRAACSRFAGCSSVCPPGLDRVVDRAGKPVVEPENARCSRPRRRCLLTPAPSTQPSTPNVASRTLRGQRELARFSFAPRGWRGRQRRPASFVTAPSASEGEDGQWAVASRADAAVVATAAARHFPMTISTAGESGAHLARGTGELRIAVISGRVHPGQALARLAFAVFPTVASSRARVQCIL